MDKNLINMSIKIAKENCNNFSQSLLRHKLLQCGFKVGAIKAAEIMDILKNKKII
ncbi:hypothetical protein Z962_p0122 (plasmid) [Clostridium botulinum C/D str. BKT12695]|nr:hypothetical protein Z962_p0122 [Clostridium botulinum C/D str. BKT12695]